MVFKTKHLTTLNILERLDAACVEKDSKKGETETIVTKSKRVTGRR